jgi:membrane fusion protein, multidrug efflux system
VREGDKAWAWRLAGNTIKKVALTLGERDPRRGDYVVAAGLADGDRLLRHPNGTLKDGQAVQPTTSAVAASSASAASSAVR